jgi:hypothetical protein
VQASGDGLNGERREVEEDEVNGGGQQAKDEGVIMASKMCLGKVASRQCSVTKYFLGPEPPWFHSCQSKI